GTFLAMKHALPHLVERRGAVVTIASTAALKGHGYGPGYTASKGGVAALTRIAAVQYGPQGVRVNCICPGSVDTPMTRGAGSPPGAPGGMGRWAPLRGGGEPGESAAGPASRRWEAPPDVRGQPTPAAGGATTAYPPPSSADLQGLLEPVEDALVAQR